MAIDSREIGQGYSDTEIVHDGTVAAGEYLLMFVGWPLDTNPDPVSISGFTQIASEDGNQFSPFLRIFERWATSSEPSSYTISASATGSMNVVLVASSGVDETDPLAADPVTSTGGRSTGSAPSVTPDGAPSRALWVVAHQNPEVEPNISWTGVDGKAGEQLSNWLHVSIAYEDRADTSSTGTRGWSFSPYSGNTDAVNAALALREGSSGPPPVDIFVNDARSVARATRPLIERVPELVVRSARAAARASRPLLFRGMAVRPARSAARASRPLLSQQLPDLVVNSARAAARASRPLIELPPGSAVCNPTTVVVDPAGGTVGVNTGGTVRVEPGHGTVELTCEET